MRVPLTLIASTGCEGNDCLAGAAERTWLAARTRRRSGPEQSRLRWWIEAESLEAQSSAAKRFAGFLSPTEEATALGRSVPDWPSPSRPNLAPSPSPSSWSSTSRMRHLAAIAGDSAAPSCLLTLAGEPGAFPWLRGLLGLLSAREGVSAMLLGGRAAAPAPGGCDVRILRCPINAPRSAAMRFSPTFLAKALISWRALVESPALGVLLASQEAVRTCDALSVLPAELRSKRAIQPLLETLLETCCRPQ